MNDNLSRLQPAEARSRLGKGLEGEPDFEDSIHDLDFLSSRLGEWTLLIDLVNGFMRKTVEFEDCTFRDAILRANRALDKRGMVYFDVNRMGDRFDALARTIEVCLKWLSPDERDRFFDLAVFPADTPIPLYRVIDLWSKSSQIDESGAEALCSKLSDLSLFSKFEESAIQIHDSILEYLKTVNQG